MTQTFLEDAYKLDPLFEHLLEKWGHEHKDEKRLKDDKHFSYLSHTLW